MINEHIISVEISFNLFIPTCDFNVKHVLQKTLLMN
jgi:hypothetical protein